MTFATTQKNIIKSVLNSHPQECVMFKHKCKTYLEMSETYPKARGKSYHHENILLTLLPFLVGRMVIFARS